MMSTISRSRSPIKLGMWLLLAPLCLWLLLLIILPHLELLTYSLSAPDEGGFTFEFYGEFFGESLYWRTFLRTAVMSILATILTLLIGFPVAFFIAKMIKGRSKGILFAMCLIPFWVSELVRTFGWMILLRESGVISTALQWLGFIDSGVELLYTDATIMLGLVYSAMLFMVVPLVSTLDSLDDSYIEAGYDLGGNNWNILREIVIPHAMPGIVSGCIIVFMLSLGNYLTPVLLGGKDSLWFTEQIYTQFITRFNWEQGSAFGILLLILSSLIVWLGLKVTGQSFTKTMG
ncbi:ABC transporter permease [Marinomonas algarum]|uniref:ABC transporter permease n=1 Tax=Marinomonas algarum TaxID=2883105 RepID=A0A9X1IKI1_9GAMM|nr:ABC transporter permease [Marinomonas algarum]MCB5161199.1 ABC transporter permease [Marinomonas algarum]